MFNQPGPPVGGEFSATSAQAHHTHSVQLVAHVIELAVEAGQSPSEPLGRLSGGRDGTKTCSATAQHGLGQGDYQRLLGRGEDNRANRGGAGGIVLPALRGEGG